MLWLEENHSEAIPADRYTLTSPDTGTTKHSVSAPLDTIGDVPQTSDDNCCSESGSSASCSNWYRPSVSTSLSAKTATPASLVSSVSGSRSSLSSSSRSGLIVKTPSVKIATSSNVMNKSLPSQFLQLCLDPHQLIMTEQECLQVKNTFN